MTEQEKSELARPLKRNLEDLVAYLAAHPDSMDACDVRWRIKIGSIALSALTASPVKKPGTECIGWVKEAIHEHDAKWRDAIRAAGYQVEGE